MCRGGKVEDSVFLSFGVFGSIVSDYRWQP